MRRKGEMVLPDKDKDKERTIKMKKTKTITRDEIVTELGDGHDYVVLGCDKKVNKDGSFWITTDEGRIKVTMDDLAEEFGVVAYLGNNTYSVKA